MGLTIGKIKIVESLNDFLGLKRADWVHQGLNDQFQNQNIRKYCSLRPVGLIV